MGFLIAAVITFLCGCGDPPSLPPAIADPAPTAIIAPPRRPNVIWILLDAARAQNFSVYGYDRPTSPNLEKLAARGAVFERAYSQASYTIASVPSYMTGRYFPVSSTSTRDWR